jgi:gamma-glutamyltranspeptidase/glutathione hydrolase
MVSSPHYLASMAGVRVLLDGGNAVDAAVASNAVLTVVYPHMSSLGGDAFWLIYPAGESRPRALNGSGRAPGAATLEWFKRQSLDAIPYRGMLPVTIPGTVDSWVEALAVHGTKPLDVLLESARTYAARGFPVTAKLAGAIELAAPLLRQNPAAAAIYLPEGRPPRPGEVLVQTDLARTLEQLARHGRDSFYCGRVADSILLTSRRLGGLLEAADLANHRSDWTEPVATTYRDTTVYEFPPPTQGILALEMLNLAEGFDLRTSGPGEADTIHILVEAKKIAYMDRDRYLTDPEFVNVPVSRLVSKEYAAIQRQQVHPMRGRTVEPSPTLPQGDTIALVAIDGWGNAVTLIQSIYMGFGSGIVADGTGIVLQNRGAYFSLDPDHPNRLEPHKRTFHTLTPGMAFRNGEFWLSFGSMGADGQPQTHVQLLTNLIDYQMNVQEAIEAPRWLSGRFFLGDPVDVLNVEARIHGSVIKELEKRGHAIRVLDEWAEVMGHAQAIEVDRDARTIAGGADPRGDGAAIGW